MGQRLGKTPSFADLYKAIKDYMRMWERKALYRCSHLLPLFQADKQVLADIKKFQAKIKLEDSLVEEAIRESTQEYVEAHLEKATQCLKQRGRVRDYSDLVTVHSHPQI